MASYQELKTRVGVKKFLLHPQNGSEDYILSFEFADGKSEAHLIKRECAPLYFDEQTTITLLASEQINATLIAVSLSQKGNNAYALLFRCWDASSSLGFTPKEIKVQDAERNLLLDGKFKSYVPVDACVEDFAFLCDNLNGYFALHAESSRIMVWKIEKTDSAGLLFEYVSSVMAKSRVEKLCFVKHQESMRLLLCEKVGISVWKIDNDTGTLLVQKTITMPALSKGPSTGISALQRVAPNVCMIAFTDRSIYTYSCMTSTLTRCFLPSSTGEQCLMSVAPTKDKSAGTLAVSYDGFTINLYSLPSILNDGAKRKATLRRPSRTIFSKLFLDALVFSGSDILVGSSVQNRCLTLWGGVKASS